MPVLLDMERTVRKRKLWGGAKGGLTIKIHALVDALENSLKFILTPGQRYEITQALALIQDMVIADKGYDPNVFAQELVKRGCIPETSPKL